MTDPADPLQTLHRDVMNIPTRGPAGTIHTGDYLAGHRDARHAAAKLVSAALAALRAVEVPRQPTTLAEIRTAQIRAAEDLIAAEIESLGLVHPAAPGTSVPAALRTMTARGEDESR
jgi:hypothetical protein